MTDGYFSRGTVGATIQVLDSFLVARHESRGGGEGGLLYRVRLLAHLSQAQAQVNLDITKPELNVMIGPLLIDSAYEHTLRMVDGYSCVVQQYIGSLGMPLGIMLTNNFWRLAPLPMFSTPFPMEHIPCQE